MRDAFGRDINYMRISVTDRCNLRCRYCMPEAGTAYFDHEEILTFEEICAVAQAAVGLGIRTFRLTGGEPLVRRDVGRLIPMLKRVSGAERLLLTTNGIRLAETENLALLDGVNLSMDTLDEKKYAYLTRRGDFSRAMKGLERAMDLGCSVKVNCVGLKGFNDDEIPAFAALAREKGIAVRFIEAMPIGQGKSWPSIAGRDVLSTIEKVFPNLNKLAAKSDGPAEYYGWEDSGGIIGLIRPMTGRFCETCNRVRLSARGFLKLCLAREDGVDLKAVLRRGGGIEALKKAMEQAILKKPAGHQFASQGADWGMNRIGG